MSVYICANYLNTRKDIFYLLETFKQQSKSDELIILSKEDNISEVPLDFFNLFQVESYKNLHPLKKLNVGFFYLFKIFGIIPVEIKNNYNIIELFRISNSRKSKSKLLFDKIILLFSNYLGKLMSYDFYLNCLYVDFDKKFNFKKNDTFIFFSEIVDNELLYYLIKNNYKVFVYVYSWDHHFKFLSFSNRINKYFVWNDTIKSDIARIHNIDLEKLVVAGSTQISFISNYKSILNKIKKIYDFLFVLSTGTHSLLVQELRLFKLLFNIYPDKNWAIRIYPFISVDLINEFQNIDSKIQILKPLDIKNSNYADFIEEKILHLNSSRFIVHCGTTLGLESSYLGHNTVFITPKYRVDELDKLYNFIHQNQNDKYLVTQNENVIHNIADFDRIEDLPRVIFKEYNDIIKAYFPRSSMQTITKTIKNEI